MKNESRKRFDLEFRLEAAQLVVDKNYSLREAAGIQKHKVRKMLMIP